MESKSNKDNKKQVSKDFLNFVKTKKAKLMNEPLDYDPDEDLKENPFARLKESQNVNFMKIHTFPILKKNFKAKNFRKYYIGIHKFFIII